MRSSKKNNTQLIIPLFVFLLSGNLIAQILIDEPPKARYYERTQRVRKLKDMKDFRDVFHYDKLLLGDNRISGNVSYNTGRVIVDDGHSKHPEYRNAIGFFTRIRFLEEFSINSTFYKDYNPEANARWISDFTYSIGRYNWRPKKVNFGYENYLNNKYTDNFNQFTDKFMEGYYFVSYNSSLSDSTLKKIRIDNSTNVKFTYFLRYSLHYKDENNVMHGGGLFSGKPTAGIACRYTLFWNIYAEGALYFYTNPSKYKQPWDPDYTYGFGYFDWRSFRISITYGNWAINRFRWNKSPYPYYGFKDGNFKVAANFIW